jgi:2-dehydropantoate 2-reductase
MKIAVVGAGGVGGYLAALLHERHEVSLVDRGEHLAALRTDGLRARSQARGELFARLPATDQPAEIGQVDLVLYCVKTYDNEVAIPSLRPLVGPETVILTFQNGVGNLERLVEGYGEEAVLAAGLVGGGTRTAPGLIEHTFTSGQEYAELGGAVDPTRRDAIVATLGATRLTVRVVENIHLALWLKLLMMAGLSAVGSLTRVKTADWRDHPATRALYAHLVAEAVAVGRAEGLPISDAEVEAALAGPDRVGPAHRTSLAIDLQRGERLEVEAIQGEIVRRAAHHGIPVPAYEVVYAVLRHADDRAAGMS